MRQGVGWLHDELPRLVAQGVLTSEAAEALRRHYGPPDAPATRTRWGQILLACFGALLVGGGVILILAHNWDALGRPARAALALSVLLAAQALTLFAVSRRADSVAWTEATSAFLVAAVGAALALVGQTYHAGGSFEDLMRGWLWLVVLIPYITGSTLASIGFWALLLVADPSGRAIRWDPWLLMLAGLPFVVQRVRKYPQSWATTLVAMSAAGSIFLVGSFLTVESGWSGLWAVFSVTLLSAIVAAASWPPDSDIAGSWRGRILVPAWIALTVVATVLSFDNEWRPVLDIERRLRNPNVIAAVLVAVACATFTSIVTVRLARASRTAAATCTAAALLVVVTHALRLGGIEIAGWIAFNVWLLAVGSLTLIEGMRTLKLGTANRGLLTLAALVVARFFDTDLSFLWRGVGFVTLGIACLALNFWLMRRVRRETI
jgi:uncharacterized membrane protein